ncbi:MAG: hypothetical protein ABW000_06605, partial [Actinoplanes sp.]
LDASREAFQRRQLRAAIRRDPDAAVLELSAAGYSITEPDQVVSRMAIYRAERDKRRRRRGKS